MCASVSDLKFESAGQKQAREQAADSAAVETAAELAAIKAQLKKQEIENAKAAKKSVRRERLAVTIGLLTLVATVLFGIIGLLR